MKTPNKKMSSAENSFEHTATTAKKATIILSTTLTNIWPCSNGWNIDCNRMSCLDRELTVIFQLMSAARRNFLPYRPRHCACVVHAQCWPEVEKSALTAERQLLGNHVIGHVDRNSINHTKNFSSFFFEQKCYNTNASTTTLHGELKW